MALDWISVVASLFWLPAFLLVIAGVPLLFPHGTSAAGWRWPTRVAFGSGLAATLMLAFTDALIHDVNPDATNPIAAHSDEVLVPAAFACVAVSVVLGLAATVRIAVRMRRLDEPERQQHAWFVAALGSLVLVSTLPLPDIIGFLGNGLFVVMLGVAVVRYQLFDIEVVLSRAVVYGVLTATAVLVYLLAVGLLGASVGGGLVPAIAVAVAALALAGLRGRLQSAVDRALYGYRDDPLAGLIGLGERLGGTVAAGDVPRVIAETVRHSLRVPYAAVAARRRGRSRPYRRRGCSTAPCEWSSPTPVSASGRS